MPLSFTRIRLENPCRTESRSVSETFDLRYTNLRRFKAHSLHLTPPAGKLRKGYERVSHNYKKNKNKNKKNRKQRERWRFES